MPLDHYISQVYLRKFLAPELGNRMHAMRKSDLAIFRPRPNDVCRIEDGNTNRYLQNERAIEDFLNDIEPRFNAAVDHFTNGVPDPEHIFCLAGLISYFLICSPASLRINSGPARAMLTSVAQSLDQAGEFPTPPESLGPGGLTDMLADGRVEMQVDPQFPGAIGIANILERVSMFGNSKWDIIANNNEGCEFFTSDYPVAIEPSRDGHVVARLVPLSPKLAVRVIPDLALRGAPQNFSFPKFRYRHLDIDSSEAKRINRLLVQCAEDLVLAPDWQSWRPTFVERHRNYRVDTVTRTTQLNDGAMIHNRVEIVTHNYQAN